MRTRDLKPGFFRNEQLAAVPFEARLLFAGLWVMADREGRLEDRPGKIKIAIFPSDNVDVDALLCALTAQHLITRYEVDGGRFIAIPSWTKHQSPHPKEIPSFIPEPKAAGKNGKPRKKTSGTGKAGTDPSALQSFCSPVSSALQGSSVPSDPQAEPRARAIPSPRLPSTKREVLEKHLEPAITLWEAQEQARSECDPEQKPRQPTEERLARIAERLEAGATLEECQHVIRVYAAECRAKHSLEWFDGVTNWRPDSFERALGRSPEANARGSPVPFNRKTQTSGMTARDTAALARELEERGE